jgi:glycosyl transferase family 87
MSRRSLLAIPIAVFAIALPLLLVHGGGRSKLPLPRSAAVRAALADPGIRAQVRRRGFDHARVTPLDSRLARVALFDGARIRAVAAVDRRGVVEHRQIYSPGAPLYGSSLSDSPWLLAALVVGFLLATATRPLVSLRNLDLVALVSLAVPIVAGDHQLFELSVLSGYPPLAYLCWRFVRRASSAGPAPAAQPLFAPAGWRVPRALAYGIGTAAVLLGIVAVSSGGAIDVGFASTAGATLLLHGTLPYGHMPPDLVHGDTYPLLNYVLYLPAAAVAPVRDAFDDTSSAVLVAFAAALLVAVALRASGRRAVLAWLCFPPVAVAVASGTNDLLLAAAVAAGLALAARGGRSALALAAGAWIKLAPLAVLPFWLARLRGRPLARALAAAAGLSASLVTWMLILGGAAAPARMVHALSFQFERGTLQSAWALLGAGGLQHVAQAATLGLIAWTALHARRVPDLDPARAAALAGAVLAALQLSASNWSYLYVVWLFPCAAMALIGEPRVEAAAGRAPIGEPRRAAANPR